MVTALPRSGLLQWHDGLSWLPVTAGQMISRSAIEAGLLCFGPNANESGTDGYGVAGVGNLRIDYAQFSYQATDGRLTSAATTFTIDATPVADAPSLMLSAPMGSNGAESEFFRTTWESAANRNANSTLLPQSELEGWRVVTESGTGGQHAFLIWSNGDRMKDANNSNRTVYGPTTGGNNWLEIGNANGQGHQTFGIERNITTRAGATYNLNLDYAGRLGYSSDFTRIGIFVDGVRIASYANTSPNTALDWKNLSFSFTGNGSAQTIRIVSEASATQSNGRGAMIDNIALTEVLPVNTGYKDSPIRLSGIIATASDTDGSESVSLVVSAIPVGATLTDGTRSFTASPSSTGVDISQWQRDRLSITAPAGLTGTFTLQVTATATETANGDRASTTLPLTISVLPTNLASPIILDLNGDGVQTLDISVTDGRFDLLNTGTAVRSGWISQGDAFLAIDSNGNGRIDDRNELFGGEVGEGFAKLASFDSNGDGQVNQSDARYNELRLWQDRDSDHQTDAGELISLTDAQIASLSVSYTIRAEHQNGNWVLERSHATTSDGRAIDMADAYFQVEASPTQSPQAINPTLQTSGLPSSSGTMNSNGMAKAAASITVQSVLPKANPIIPAYRGMVAQPFAQRTTHDSILIGAPVLLKRNEQLAGSEESGEYVTALGQDEPGTIPVIDWNRDNMMEPKQNDVTTTTKVSKHRRSKWMVDFVNGRDGKTERTLLDGLRITLPTTGLTKGK